MVVSPLNTKTKSRVEVRFEDQKLTVLFISPAWYSSQWLIMLCDFCFLVWGVTFAWLKYKHGWLMQVPPFLPLRSVDLQSKY